MAALHDKIKPTWMRLMKSDGHLGGLYDPRRGILRLIGRGGTVDYDLVALAQDAEPKEQQVTQPRQ